MSEDFLAKLNKEQRQAVTHTGGPALVVAGAGTGKTTVIVNRILWLIQNQGLQPDNILALTFTDKAAHEMEERVDALLPYGYVNLWINTFHKFCERVLRTHGLDIGLHTDFRVISGTEQWILVRNHLDRFDLEYFKPHNNPTKFIQTLLGHFSRCKDEDITAQQYVDFIEELKNDSKKAYTLFGVGDHFDKLDKAEQEQIVASQIKKYDEVSRAYFTYQQILLENNYLDFGDLLQCTLKLFNRRPAIINEYRQQFKHVLVDEFQDTNSIQYQIVQLLVHPNNNLMVVGDDDQSIYRFRGASIQNIMQFKEDYPNAVDIVLTQNYRSAQEILDIAYKSINQNNPYRLEEKLGINKELKAFSDQQGWVEHIHMPTVVQEVEAVIKKILDIKEKNPDVKWSDFAILMRANNQAGNFIQVCEQKHIPYEFVASKGLYIKPVILDIISYLKVLYNHHDDSALYRVLNIPAFNIGYDDIVKLTQYTQQKGITLYDALGQITAIPNISADGATNCSLVVTLLHKQADLLQQKTSISDLLVLFLHDSGYLDYLTKDETVDNYYALTHLEQFHKKVKAFLEQHPDGSLKDFLDILVLELESGETGNLHNDTELDDDKVQMLTIHASKGLEFKYVFVVHLVDKRFPTIRRSESLPIPATLMPVVDSDHDDMHVHEERRLFYVAMTRAKEQLFFTSADNYGGVRKKKISLFLQELGYSANISDMAQQEVGFVKPEVGAQEKKTQKQPLPKKFSFTQLKDFDTCPLLYKYKYILKIPTRGNRHMSFGSSMHRTLEKFFRDILTSVQAEQGDLFAGLDVLPKAEDVDEHKIPTKKQLFDYYEECWIDHWYESKQQQTEYKERGKQMLSDFYDDYVAGETQIYQVEQPFNVKLGNYTIAGRIDRIDSKKDGTFEIIDYKTGTPKDKLSKDDKRQLSLYQLASEQLLKLHVTALTYYYLQNSSSTGFTLTEKDKAGFEKWVISTIEKIKDSDFAATPGRHCQYCQFNSICDFRET